MNKSVLLIIFSTVLITVNSKNIFAQEAVAPAPTDILSVPAGTPPPEVIGATPMPPPNPEMTDPLLEGFFEDIGYSATNRRDPFLPYLNPEIKNIQAEVILEPLQKFALGELNLVGIIWDVGRPKALIQDPSGKSHIIIENTKMGSGMGYVAAIREGEIIVVEPQLLAGKKSFQTKIIKLSSIKGITP